MKNYLVIIIYEEWK